MEKKPMYNNIKHNININIDKLLQEAMKSELEAKKFYINASTKAQSKAGKKLFNELADFEQNHYERIKNIIESRNKGIKIEIHQSKKNNITLNSEIKGEIEPNKDEIVSVFNLAIDSEKKAQKRYKKIADMFKDDESKDIFYDLARDEENHQRILEDEFYELSNNGIIIWE
jgi:rubrerythrin